MNLRNVVRWSRPGTTAYTTVHVWRGSLFSWNEDSQGAVIATVSIFAGSQFIGTYQDTTGSRDDFYAIRYYDGTYPTPWSAKVLANAGPSFAAIQDLYDLYADLNSVLGVYAGTNDVGSNYFMVARRLNTRKRHVENALRSTYPTPLLPNSDGLYDEALVDITARWVVADVLERNLADQSEDIPKTVAYFRDTAGSRLQGLLTREELLSAVRGFAEIGIGSPIPGVDNHGGATLHVDDTRIYTGDTEKTFLLEMQTTGSVGTATFRWSIDNGRTWAQSNVVTQAYDGGTANVATTFGPTHLASDVRVWWDKQGDTGLQDCVAGDRWTIRCVPLHVEGEGGGFFVGRVYL